MEVVRSPLRALCAPGQGQAWLGNDRTWRYLVKLVLEGGPEPFQTAAVGHPPEESLRVVSFADGA